MVGALLGAVLCWAILLFARPPAWFPEPASLFGRQFDGQFQFSLAVIAVLFIGAHLALVAAASRHRRSVAILRQGWRIETLWTAVAFLIFGVLAFTGSRIWAGTHPSSVPADAERIEVYAHQFAWNFRYPGADRVFGRTSLQYISDVLDNPFGLDPNDPAGRDDLRSATLRVPSGREVLLLLHSRDVIHDFFVRELRFKQDVVPGMEIPYRFRADKTGIFEIACSELCGLGHSQMRAVVEVMQPDAFDKWKSARSLAAATR